MHKYLQICLCEIVENVEHQCTNNKQLATQMTTVDVIQNFIFIFNPYKK